MTVVSMPQNKDLLVAMKHGAVLLRTDAPVPESIRMEKRPLARQWTMVSNRRPAEVEREIARAGWHLFFIPPEFQVSALARDESRAIEKALAKMFGEAEARRMNALEITGLSLKKWAGLYRASVSGFLRHLQQSYIFQESKPPAVPARRLAA